MPDDPELPLSTATLKRLLAEAGALDGAATTTPFRLGPSVLRAPPPGVRRPDAPADVRGDDDDDGAPETADLLGELLDMVLVGADDADSGLPEVHLQFKASVFGGLHLRMVKRAGGLDATFLVKDAAARRYVSDHVDALVAHLKERGFALLSHELRVLPSR